MKMCSGRIKVKLGNREGRQQNILACSEVKRIYKQLAANEKRDDGRADEGAGAGRRGRGPHLRGVCMR